MGQSNPGLDEALVAAYHDLSILTNLRRCVAVLQMSSLGTSGAARLVVAWLATKAVAGSCVTTLNPASYAFGVDVSTSAVQKVADGIEDLQRSSILDELLWISGFRPSGQRNVTYRDGAVPKVAPGAYSVWFSRPDHTLKYIQFPSVRQAVADVEQFMLSR